MTFANELSRRNVFRVAAAYLVVGWLLTEVLTTILPELGAPAWAPRAVILLFALGFLPTIVLSWVYEITPEGIKRESELDSNDGGRRWHGRFDYLVIGAAFVLVVVLAVLGARTGGDAPAGTKTAVVSEASVAVLPFVNMSADEDDAYFSDGLTESLLHMLTQVSELRVAARTSSFAFKGQNKPVGEIAKDLKVAHILEGSVQRSGNRVRITAQLIRAADGFHVWSERFDRDYDDIFEIQDEIATRVANALTVSLLGTAPSTAVAGVGTENTDAYELYLQALGLGSTLSYGGLQAAENMFKAALATDPGFLDAKVQLAMNYVHQRDTGLLSNAEAVARIDELTTEVLDERPGDALAQALALFADVIRNDNATTAEQFFDTVDRFERLVAENPATIEISMMLSDLLVGLQRYDRAEEILAAAIAIDEFNPRLHFELGIVYLLDDRPGDARAATRRSLELEPRQPGAHLLLSQLARNDGDAVGVVRHLLNALNEDPRDHEIPGEIALFLYDLGLLEAADDFRKMLLAAAPESEYAHLAELERAIRIGDVAAAEASARRAVENEIDVRRGGFAIAVRFLLRLGVATGRTDEITDWIETEAPGIFDVDAEAVPGRYRAAQIVAMESWYATLPRAEFLSRLDALLAAADEFGLDLADDAQSVLAVQLMRGELDAALDTALDDVFSEPVTTYPGWRRTFAQPLYRELVADPRIRDAMAEWDREHETMGADVRNFLAELSTGE